MWGSALPADGKGPQKRVLGPSKVIMGLGFKSLGFRGPSKFTIFETMLYGGVDEPGRLVRAGTQPLRVQSSRKLFLHACYRFL